MQSISVFLDIIKTADFCWKMLTSAELVCHVLIMVFGPSITVPSFIIERYVWQIKSVRRRDFPPILEQLQTLTVKLSNSLLNELKFGTKSSTEINLNLSSNLIGNSCYETKFPHKLFLTDTQVFSGLRKAFANGSSSNIIF